MSKIKLYGKKIKRFMIALFGCFIYAVGMNLFIIPENTFSGGLVGLSQLIGLFANKAFGITINLAGIVYYIINIPIAIWAYKSIGRKFILKTIACITALSLFMSLLPIPATPILGDDILASCVIGGIITGVGIGLSLRYGSSMGGLDIVGLILTAQKKSSSIGTLYLVVNAILYSICFFTYDVKTVIYSMIVAAVASFAMDKVHFQNINVEVKVITKNLDKTMQDEIMGDMYRGITRLDCKGAYTEDDEYIFYILMSKHEVPQLREIVHKYDPNAWIVVNEKVSVYGAFVKKM